ncbi:hypothetical protein V1514DRAFT_328272 [Lipomyces japonicus]|uniref:uncharacterized protein n=1 Tax=Lipomyces japonicus TaxID=56871 RepID=UPI0034CD5F7F
MLENESTDKAANVLPEENLDFEKIKNRRTRSGCFTCRQRRVKCDETRPMCFRCSKGNRDCKFPEALMLSKKQRAQIARRERRAELLAKKQAASKTADAQLNFLRVDTPISPELYDEPDSSAPELVAQQIHRLPPRPRDTTSLSPRTANTTLSEDSYLLFEKHTKDFPYVPSDISTLLCYHRKNLSHLHYFLSTDPILFFDGILISCHLSEPLMYALAAFTSYHCALRQGEFMLENMFQYYEKCIRSLISAVENPGIYDMIAILILACLETYLGDVANEIKHQDAVFNMFNRVYTPETVFETEEQTFLFNWIRYIDLRRTVLSGTPMKFGRRWHQSHRLAQARVPLSGPKWALHRVIGNCGFLFFELCNFAMAVRNGMITEEQSARNIEVIRAKSMTWFESLDPVLLETVEAPQGGPLSDEDRQLVPPLCYKTWEIGFLMIIYQAYKLYFSAYSSLSSLKKFDRHDAATTEIAVIMARCVSGFEATEHVHPGALFTAHTYLCIGAGFMPPHLHNWVRRKLALIQAKGFYFPEQVRLQIANTWKNNDLYRGWLEGLEDSCEKFLPAGVIIPWERLQQVKQREFNKESESFITALTEMRGVFIGGV